VRGGGDVGDAEPVESRGQRGDVVHQGHPLREVARVRQAAEDGHVVRARIAHGLQERGYVGDVVGVARRRVAGEAGFDVTYLRRRSVQDGETPQRQPMDVIYVFDGPSIGLHPRDVHRLNELLQKLRDKGNTALVVEHDPDVIKVADHVVDVGPHAGTLGGTIVYEGSYAGHLFNRGNIKV